MELPFEKTVCRHWKQKQYSLVSREESQEVRLPESFPDIGRVISSWGQVIVRGKDWRSTGVGINGGVMIWVLYAPEGGGPLQRIESWIPFQARVDFGDSSDDGVIRVESVLKNVDARNMSSRKLMLRVSVGLLIQTLVPHQTEVPKTGELPGDVEQLKNTYPLMLTMEAGEKAFLADEEISLPAGMPNVEKLVYFRMEPELQEQRVMGSRGVFRGVGNLHFLYMDEAQKLYSHDVQVPFAQYVELEGEYESEAKISTVFCVTSLELEPGSEGGLRMKCGMAGQYMITAPIAVEILEDAYSPCRDVELVQEALDLPALLDDCQECMEFSETVSDGDANTVVDQVFCPDLPMLVRQPGSIDLECGGSFQALLQAGDGSFTGKAVRSAGKRQMRTDCDTVCFHQVKGNASCRKEGGGWRFETQVVLDLKSVGNQPLKAVSAVKLGEVREPDARRPSMIIRAKDPEQSLWELAKSHGSTVDAIRRINQLDRDPEDDRLLLIPVI